MSLSNCKNLLFFLATALLGQPCIQAQKVVTRDGEYKLILSDNENVTIREAKNRCIELAKAEAIKNEFGMLVSSDIFSSDRVSNDGSSSFFAADTYSGVRGEWLGDETPPQVTIETDGQDIIFTARVHGKIREIVRAATDIKWQIAKNVDGQKLEAECFESGDRFFVNFLTPVDGYVAVYLMSDDDVSCLLPYPKDPTGRVEVKHGRVHTFFDRETDKGPYARYYKLSTDKLEEHHQLYIIFSPNPFTKCTDTSVSKNAPNVLSSKEFTKWLINQQRADKDMVVGRKWIKVTGHE